MEKQPREFFDLAAYVSGKRQKIGYAYKTEKGSICLKADEDIDPATLGQLVIKGLYIQKRKSKAQAGREYTAYQSFADEYDRETAHAVSNQKNTSANTSPQRANAAYILRPPRP